MKDGNVATLGRKWGRAWLGYLTLLASMLLQACNTGEGSAGAGTCRQVCQRVAAAQCGPFDEDICTTRCEEQANELPEGCESTYQSLINCLATAQIVCEEVQQACSPPPCSDPAPREPKFVGCSTEGQALDDGCSPQLCSGRTSSFQVLPDGSRMTYSVELSCEPCPPTRGAPPGGTCSAPADCAALCCDCGPNRAVTHACIDGRCASTQEVCQGQPSACTRFL